MNLPTSLQTSSAQHWEEHKVIFQMYSIGPVIKQPILHTFCSIHYLTAVKHSVLLVYITVSVSSYVILPEFQQHMCQRWSAFQQCIVDELINYRHAPCFRLITVKTRCYTSQSHKNYNYSNQSWYILHCSL